MLVDPDPPAERFLERLADRDGLGVPFGEGRVRFCTHLGVDRADIERAIDRIAAAV